MISNETSGSVYGTLQRRFYSQLTLSCRDVFRATESGWDFFTQRIHCVSRLCHRQTSRIKLTRLTCETVDLIRRKMRCSRTKNKQSSMLLIRNMNIINSSEEIRERESNGVTSGYWFFIIISWSAMYELAYTASNPMFKYVTKATSFAGPRSYFTRHISWDNDDPSARPS